MKIRAVTFFCQPGWPINRTLLGHAGIFSRHAQAEFMKAGFEVQSLRMATPAFTRWFPQGDWAQIANILAIETHAEGFEYLSLGPIPLNETQFYEHIPLLLSASKGLFISGSLTEGRNLSLAAAKACAQTIHQLAMLEEGGFANLRFAALANVAPYAPFFPAAHAAPGKPAFALALEAADLAVQSFTSAKSLSEARESLIRSIESHAARLETIGNKLASIYHYDFRGLDFTLAPTPSHSGSIATALEALGLPAFGLHGSLFASTFLTDTLDKASYKRTGFNGLMLPVLEDAGLADRSAEGTLTTQNLLLNSAVCGTGLDVIPLPGDVSEEQLYAVLLDVGALALRLNKPLTARLMPIPGKWAGEKTDFQFDYFANAAILGLPAQPLNGLLNGDEETPLNPKN
ncbi:MAG: DUF711 family protein [Anaerolineaceae bacterium]|jgi:uncharacterized protein (UPF0210 family)